MKPARKTDLWLFAVGWLLLLLGTGCQWIARVEADFLYLQARKHDAVRHYAEALELFQEAADKGKARAFLDLGLYYYNGHGTEKDSLKAIQSWQQAAEAGFPEGYKLLGFLYYDEKDYQKARFYWQKAVEMGYLPAYGLVGMLYLHGQGGPVEIDRYVATMQEAIAKGSIEAEVDLKKFLEDIAKAAQAGNEESHRILQDLRDKGLIADT